MANYYLSNAQNAGADSQYADGFLCIGKRQEPSPWTLTYSLYDKDTACAVVAAKDADTYLVAAGVQDTAAVQADDGASKYVSTGERRYALISKADYWSGNANYRDLKKSADTQAYKIFADKNGRHYGPDA